jgi:hypothetical protein
VVGTRARKEKEVTVLARVMGGGSGNDSRGNEVMLY